jgi:hypothetical protein
MKNVLTDQQAFGIVQRTIEFSPGDFQTLINEASHIRNQRRKK